jgi:outer membrane receptor for ferrienterochelin and colicins
MTQAFRLALFAALTLMLLVHAVPTLAGEQPSKSAQVAGQADEAQFYFLRGNRAYQDRRYEDALAAYYLSNRLVPNRNVQFNIARCLDRLGRYDEAYRAWSSLLEQGLPDKEAKAARDAIDEMRPHLALVKIDTTPEQATIFVGRRDLGALGLSPKSLALRPGKTKIILDREGYRTVELDAEPVPGKEIVLSATLERIYGAIEVRHVPDNAEIRRDFIDGDILRRGPGKVTLLPGPLVLFVSAPGYQTARLMVNAQPDATVPVDVLLTPAVTPTGMLVVRANINGALVRVDGKESGFAPTVIDGVPTGARQVEIVAEGRRPFTGTFEVKRGQRTFVDAQLGHADPEVTAATKSQVAAESAPASISVVTADEIAALGYTTLSEALLSIRGTFSSYDRSYESVGFRGFSPPGDYTNRVLVLVDGHSINDAVTGQGYVGHDLDVDLANVARIEIVRGPGSVLYGTGALFGVINVVTRRAAEGVHAGVETMAGSQNMGSARATASARRGGAELMLSLAALSSDGDRRFQFPGEFNNGTPVTVLDADGEKVGHASMTARLGPVSLSAGYNERRKYIPTGAYDSTLERGPNNHDKRGFAELRFDHGFHGVGISLRGAYDYSWYHGRFDQPPPDSPDTQDLRAQWATGELRIELPRFLRQRLTLGSEVVRHLDLLTDPPSGGNLPAKKDLIVSAYVVDDIQLTSRLAMNLGLRSDSYTRSFGTTFNPRVAVIGRPYDGGNTKIFFGRSFRAPSPNERVDTAGEELRPEIIWNGEIEHTHAINDDTYVVVSAFASWLDNLIVLTEDNTYFNEDDRIRSIGAEGELRWEPGGGTLIATSVTRQKVEQLSADGNRPFVNAPETLFKARVLTPLAGPMLRLGSELVLDGGRHFRTNDPTLPSSASMVDDAVIWNLSFSGEYRRYHLRYFAGVFNLLDVHDPHSGFPTSADYPLPLVPRYGRTIRAGLAWSF